MAHATDFVGHLDIDPPLNDAEAAYLTVFAHTRVAALAARGAPHEPSPWLPCSDGCCLSYDGVGRPDEPVAWLRFLLDDLLKPGAESVGSTDPRLADFTFDHRVDGIVVGCRRDTRELFSIVVEENRVSREVLVPGDPEYRGQPPLAYQRELDKALVERRRRRGEGPELDRRTPPRDAVVVDLQSRRRYSQPKPSPSESRS